MGGVLAAERSTSGPPRPPAGPAWGGRPWSSGALRAASRALRGPCAGPVARRGPPLVGVGPPGAALAAVGWVLARRGAASRGARAGRRAGGRAWAPLRSRPRGGLSVAPALSGLRPRLCWLAAGVSAVVGLCRPVRRPPPVRPLGRRRPGLPCASLLLVCAPRGGRPLGAGLGPPSGGACCVGVPALACLRRLVLCACRPGALAGFFSPLRGACGRGVLLAALAAPAGAGFRPRGCAPGALCVLLLRIFPAVAPVGLRCGVFWVLCLFDRAPCSSIYGREGGAGAADGWVWPLEAHTCSGSSKTGPGGPGFEPLVLQLWCENG